MKNKLNSLPFIILVLVGKRDLQIKRKVKKIKGGDKEKEDRETKHKIKEGKKKRKKIK